MKSIAVMLTQLEGMLGTRDLTDWEAGFVESVVATAEAYGTQALSTKQVETVESIYRKNFGDAK